MSESKIYRLMKSIFLIVVSIAVFLIGFVGSGGTYSSILAVTYVLGIALFLFGLIGGISTILSDKGEVS